MKSRLWLLEGVICNSLPKRAPTNIALAQIFIIGGLANEKVDLLSNSKAFIGIKIATWRENVKLWIHVIWRLVFTNFFMMYSSACARLAKSQPFDVSIFTWFLKCQFGSLLQTQKKIYFESNLIILSLNLIFTVYVAYKNKFRNQIDCLTLAF